MVSITNENFESEQKSFLKRAPDLWLMICPDRPFDHAAHRYADHDAQSKGNAAMKAWFEYLAAKGFIRTFNAWRAILKSGKPIMVVCADPVIFDPHFEAPSPPVLPPDFWDKFEQSRIPVDRRYEDQELRERIIDGFNELRRELRAGKGQPRVKGWSTLRDAAVKPLREWTSTPLAECPTLPPQLSAELQARLGCGARGMAAE